MSSSEPVSKCHVNPFATGSFVHQIQVMIANHCGWWLKGFVSPGMYNKYIICVSTLCVLLVNCLIRSCEKKHYVCSKEKLLYDNGLDAVWGSM